MPEVDNNPKPPPVAPSASPPSTPPVATSANNTWLGQNTAPVIALGTVILTFAMFAYFVNIAHSPSKEVVNLLTLQKTLAETKLKFTQVSSTKADKKETGKLDELKKDIDKLNSQITCAKDAAEDAKERRGMVKDFVLYILGVLSSALTTIFGYYFGSSKGSSVKSDALNIIANKVQTQPSADGK